MATKLREQSRRGRLVERHWEARPEALGGRSARRGFIYSAYVPEAIAGDVEELAREHVLEVHRVLFAGTRDEQLGGLLREEQNWIGGAASNPRSAEFIPPPHELVPELIDDLCAFCNREDVPAVIQAAIAHSQFETIHPFHDGNGRVDRALI